MGYVYASLIIFSPFLLLCLWAWLTDEGPRPSGQDRRYGIEEDGAGITTDIGPDAGA